MIKEIENREYYQDLQCAKEKVESGFEIIHFYKAVEEVKGKEALNKAKEKRNEIGDNDIFYILDQLGILLEEEIVSLIKSAFKNSINDLQVVEIGDLVVKNGKVFYDNSEVVPCILPKVGIKEKLVILKPSEYKQLEKNILNINEDNTKKESDKKDIVQKNLQENIVTFDFETIVREAVAADASDIHIIYGADKYTIHFRIDGDLVIQRRFLMRLEQGIKLIKEIQLIANKYTKGKFKADVLYKAQDARIEFKKYNIDLRVSTMPDGTLSKNTVVMRILKKTSIDAIECKFSEYGYGAKFEEAAKNAARKRGGLFIASGITGSGKSTLISNIIRGIPENKRIYTIEDPIEYEISMNHVSQHAIFEPKSDSKEGDDDKKMGFAEYMKSIKRGDPNVIFLGEMRKEKELVETLVEGSEAGVLSFTTVHIRSAFNIFDALERVFGIPKQTSIDLILFSVNQTLVKKLCDDCKIKDVEDKNLDALEKLKKRDEIPYSHQKSLDDLLNDSSYLHNTYKKGNNPHCKKCNGEGYQGRVPVYEWFRMTQTLREQLLGRDMKPFEIEKEVCLSGIGENKLDTFVNLVKKGEIDVSDENISDVF